MIAEVRAVNHDVRFELRVAGHFISMGTLHQQMAAAECINDAVAAARKEMAGAFPVWFDQFLKAGGVVGPEQHELLRACGLPVPSGKLDLSSATDSELQAELRRRNARWAEPIDHASYARWVNDPVRRMEEPPPIYVSPRQYADLARYYGVPVRPTDAMLATEYALEGYRAIQVTLDEVQPGPETATAVAMREADAVLRQRQLSEMTGGYSHPAPRSREFGPHQFVPSFSAGRRCHVCKLARTNEIHGW